MSYISIIQKEFKFHFDALKQNYIDSKDKDMFRASGVSIYCGWQGSGKTLSAVKHVNNLLVKYPKAILVTNLNIDNKYLKNKIISFSDHDKLHELLVSVENGKYGVIYLIDEIHTYFNALESKNIPPYIFTEISQQRKQRKPGRRMSARPATARLVGRRPGAQQLAVRLLAAKLLDAPRALHPGHRLQR